MIKTQLDRGDPVPEEEFQRLKTEVNHKRVVRNLEEVSDSFVYTLILGCSLNAYF